MLHRNASRQDQATAPSTYDGVCCGRVRAAYRSLVSVQFFIARPRTQLTADWLGEAHRHMDRVSTQLKLHPAPFSRCCFHGESGYPLHWAE